MFTKLTDFGYKRSGKEAFGFYIAYLLFGIVLGALAGALYASVTLDASSGFQDGVAAGQRVGGVIAILFPLVLAFLVVTKRNLTKDFLSILLAILSGILGLFGGGLLGLIPVAYLTTKK